MKALLHGYKNIYLLYIIYRHNSSTPRDITTTELYLWNDKSIRIIIAYSEPKND